MKGHEGDRCARRARRALARRTARAIRRGSAHASQRGVSGVRDEALQSVLQDWHVEIDQEGLRHARQAEVRQRLRVVRCGDVLEDLQLDKQGSIDDELRPVGAGQDDAIVDERQRDLPVERQPRLT